jgi:hypothetical protein
MTAEAGIAGNRHALNVNNRVVGGEAEVRNKQHANAVCRPMRLLYCAIPAGQHDPVGEKGSLDGKLRAPGEHEILKRLDQKAPVSVRVEPDIETGRRRAPDSLHSRGEEVIAGLGIQVETDASSPSR